jgi:hypothetical protein
MRIEQVALSFVLMAGYWLFGGIGIIAFFVARFAGPLELNFIGFVAMLASFAVCGACHFLRNALQEDGNQRA